MWFNCRKFVSWATNKFKKQNSGKIVTIFHAKDKTGDFHKLHKKKKLLISMKKESVYVYSYWTWRNKNLFYETKMHDKENNFKFVRFKNSKIFNNTNENEIAVITEDEHSVFNLIIKLIYII